MATNKNYCHFFEFVIYLFKEDEMKEHKNNF